MGILKKMVGLERQPEETEVMEEVATENEPSGNADQENALQSEDQWLEDNYEEGQLSIDVYQTPENLVVKSTIAGVKPEDIDISINNDMLTIRGKREMAEIISDQDYLYRECYWGSFSRSVILPTEVKADKIDAFLENGVLTIVLPKARASRHISIKVKEK